MSRSIRRIILGISTGHGDSSAALVVDDQLVAAVEEERFVRKKHYALFPEQSIRYCLEHAGVKAEEVNAIAIPRKPLNGWMQKLRLALVHPQLLSSRKKSGGPSLGEEFEKLGLGGTPRVRVEHHLAHLASARPLAAATDKVALLSFDGLGDFVSTTFGVSQGPRARILDRLYFPHSLGLFYTAMTQYLGFPYFGDEFKVMGLSSYGRPTLQDKVAQLATAHPRFGFRLDLRAFPILARPLHYEIREGQPYISPFFDAHYLEGLLGIPPRSKGAPLTDAHRDLALSVQRHFEQVAFHLLHQLHRKVGGREVAIAGGCAHNSAWAGKIPQHTPFERVHIAPAASDAGIAVGAAIQVANRTVRPQGGHWALLGPGPKHVPSPQKEFESEQALCEWLARELAEGKIVGFFNGRMEFGPRALGSRSILADPRHPDMRDRLNERVKHRETFRPFAASVLWERQSNWFENSFYSPSMEAVFVVPPEKRDKIPSVVHGDQTCRIQSVTRDTQPLYHALITEFERITGVPMLINTSFNDSEPIVCSAQDALNCFQNSDIDHLVMGLGVFSKSAFARTG